MSSVLVDLGARTTCDERPTTLLPLPGHNLSIFYATLTAPYDPAAPISHDLEVSEDLASDPILQDSLVEDRCGESEVVQRRPVNANLPPDQLQPLYIPHGKWAAAGLNPIVDWKILTPFRADSGVRKGHLAGNSITYINRRWSLSQVGKWDEFVSEIALYKSSKHLQPLQGLVVPHIINVCGTPGHIDTAMELPHDCFWIEASPDMPVVLKKRCIEAYEKLHKQGVLHGSVELRHILIGADCKVTIVDFRFGRSSSPIPEAGIRAASSNDFQMEMRRVKFKLDYQGARKKEHAKIQRAAALTEINKNIVLEISKQGRCPELEDLKQPDQDDIADPVISRDLWSNEWLVGCQSSPRRFVVPGRTSHDVRVAMESFLASVSEMETKARSESSSDIITVADHAVDDTFDLIDTPFVFEYRLEKRKRDVERLDSVGSSNVDGRCSCSKRRRLSDTIQTPQSPHIHHDSHERHRKRKRKRADHVANFDLALEQLSFSEFMLLAEMEKDLERDRERKRRKSSLTSVTAEYGSDRARSISPPPIASNPEVDLCDVGSRRTSPCLSAEEAARRMPSATNPLPPPVKSAPPIIVRDYVHKQFDGPKGYYVPHPPAENRVGLERAKYIRQYNAITCVNQGLRYPTVENSSGEVVPSIYPLPYNFQYEQERGKSARKRNRQRGLGGLIRKRNMEQFNDQEIRDMELVRCWEEMQDMGTMSKVRFPELDSGLRIDLGPDAPQGSDRAGQSSGRSHPTHGILKTSEPIKTYNYQVPWEELHDVELSPKLGPLPEKFDRSGGFGMLGVGFSHNVAKTEESYRKEILNRIQVSDTIRAGVELMWKEEEERTQEMRRIDMGSSLEGNSYIELTSAISFELEEERLVEEMLIGDEEWR